MSHEYRRPNPHEVEARHEPITLDSLEADTRLAAGTRKLMMVMFQLLKMPPIPSQEAIDAHIAEVVKDSGVNDV